jgi:hypothetical protein
MDTIRWSLLLRHKGFWLAIGLTLIVIGTVPGCGDETGNPSNSLPVIDSLTVNPDTVDAFTSTTLTCWARDYDGDDLVYIWSAFTGTIVGSGSAIRWIAPRTVATHWVFVTVEDGRGGSASDTARVEVLEPPEDDRVEGDTGPARGLAGTTGGGNHACFSGLR